MEAYSSSSSSSSSSLMNLSSQKLSHSSLRSVRKPQVKPWKKPIAPLPPTPPRVYKVDPINFRDLVQMLTGSPDPIEKLSEQPQRLQKVAPPPLDLYKKPALFSRDLAAANLRLLEDSQPVKTPISATYQEFISDTTDPKSIASSALELNLLSPSTHAWCSIPLLSPGTLSSLEQSTVL